jgi:hypothetical protein
VSRDRHCGADPLGARLLDQLLTAVEADRRWWVQYADGGQINLVVLPAANRPGRAPHSVALLDRHGRLAQTFTPHSWTAAPDEPRRWLLDGWEALTDRPGAHRKTRKDAFRRTLVGKVRRT